MRLSIPLRSPNQDARNPLDFEGLDLLQTMEPAGPQQGSLYSAASWLDQSSPSLNFSLQNLVMEVFGEAPQPQSAAAAVPAVVLPELSVAAAATMAEVQVVALSSVSSVPNDPGYVGGYLWGMQGGFGSRADVAWAAGTTGKMNNVVGVIDTGIDYTHRDLYLNIWLNQREIPTELRASLSDFDVDGLITFHDLNNSANASYVSDFNGNRRIDAGDLLKDTRWANNDDLDRNGRNDDLIGWDFVNNDNDPMDDNIHGTHVAGTIGARGGDGYGVVGVNWNVQMVALKSFGASGPSPTSIQTAAVNYFTDAAINAVPGENFVATNNSWGNRSGAAGFDSNLQAAILRAAEQDILFIASAGNDTRDNDATPVYPAYYETTSSSYGDVVVSVASITNTGARSSFSNIGRSSVDIGAPGGEGVPPLTPDDKKYVLPGNIWSTIPLWVTSIDKTPVDDFASLWGTSMAAPHVTGAMALYASLFPYATSAQIRDALLGSAEFTAALNGLVATNGRLDIPDMLAIRPRATEFRDVLVGDASADVFDGRAGNDSLVGNAGADTLSGGIGADTLDGGADADMLNGGDGVDLIVGGADGDFLVGGAGFDNFDGGTGADTVSFASETLAVIARLDLDFVQIGADTTVFETLSGIEAVIGSNFNDVINGRAGVAETILAGAGDDNIYGEGIDLINGGGGHDVLWGAPGAALSINLAGTGLEVVWGGWLSDSLDGRTCTDALVLHGQGPTGDTMLGGSNNDSIYFRTGDVISGGQGFDWAYATLSATGVTLDMVPTQFENAWGSRQADTISAAGAVTTVVIIGDTGNDLITGGSSGDFLYGFAGFDTLIGGLGNDNLSGNDGNDVFRFNASSFGVDQIWDFAAGDRIDLASSGVTRFSDLTVSLLGNHSVVTSTATGDSQIWVLNMQTLTAADFIFV